MNYEQFVRSQILFRRAGVAGHRAGRVLVEAGIRVPVEEMRANPWGGDWPMCIDCIADQGLDDSLVSDDEYNEHLSRIPPWKPQREQRMKKKQNNANHRHN